MNYVNCFKSLLKIRTKTLPKPTQKLGVFRCPYAVLKNIFNFQAQIWMCADAGCEF